MRREIPPTLRWVLLALLGLLVAIAVGIAASELTSRRIGLSSEPIRAGDALAPAPERPEREHRGERRPEERGEESTPDVDEPTTETTTNTTAPETTTSEAEGEAEGEDD